MSVANIRPQTEQSSRPTSEYKSRHKERPISHYYANPYQNNPLTVSGNGLNNSTFY
jgi:hypothetical protein